MFYFLQSIFYKCVAGYLFFASTGHRSYAAEWSRLKGFIILLIASAAMSLIAEVIADNIQPVLRNFHVSEVGDFSHIHSLFSSVNSNSWCLVNLLLSLYL